MDRIRNKLRAKDGVSILMGLLFLLVCVMVGTVVLTASTAASGRLAWIKESEQDYQTVASAARLMRNRIGVLTYTHTRTTITYSDGTLGSSTATVALDASSGSVILKEDLLALCRALLESTDSDYSASPGTKGFTISTASSDWKDVEGTIEIASDGTLVAKLLLKETDGTKHNPVELEFTPNGPTVKTESFSEEISEDVFKETKIVTTTCSWPEGACTIKKGTA